jgi:hypothetical protein
MHVSALGTVAALPDADGMVLVRLPSGATFPVHSEEVDYITERVGLYLQQNHFPNISDLQDVDRMLVLELMCYRWGVWLSRQKNWWGDSIDENETQKAFSQYSSELRQLKKLLGIDKMARDKQKGEDSVTAYLANLQIRAKEFGVMRESQLDKALELFHEMKALLTLNRNCDDQEKREMHVTDADVLEWLHDIAIPEFDSIDEYFRTHQQRTWIRAM